MCGAAEADGVHNFGYAQICFRQHPTKQSFFNRKGLLSDKGLKKRVWFLMKDYYAEAWYREEE